jgi:RNA polymerase sigma-70 factor (ECF subfamily)
VDIIQASSVQIREENIPSIVQAKQIVDCIRLLPVGYRTVLNLYAIEGYAHKEIAEMLDIEESTSRSQYTRARQMLEEILIRRNLIPAAKEKNDRLTAVH